MGPLAPLIEFLRAQRYPGTNDPLVGQAAGQTEIPNFLPGQVVVVDLVPTVGVAAIGYYITADRNVVLPDVFSVKIFQWAQEVVSGVIDQTIIENGIPAFLFVTEAQPVRFELTNRDNVVRSWRNDLYYLSISSHAVLEMVYDHIRRYASVQMIEPLLVQIRNELRNPSSRPAGAAVSTAAPASQFISPTPVPRPFLPPGR